MDRCAECETLFVFFEIIILAQVVCSEQLDEFTGIEVDDLSPVRSILVSIGKEFMLHELRC